MTRLTSTGRWMMLFLGICLPWFMQVSALSQEAGRSTYNLGTGTPEGIAHPLGVTIAALIKLKLLPQANVDIDARNSQGSRANALGLRDAELDFGILSDFDAYQAFHGTGPFAENGADESLRLVTRLWTSTYHFVVKKEFATTGTLDDFLGLEGKRLALGEEGSSLRDHARTLFEALDVTVEDVNEIVDLEGRTARQAFLDGDLDGFLLVDDNRGADVAAFLDDTGDRATLLAVEDDRIETIRRRGTPAWTRVVVPANVLPDRDRDHVTLGMGNLLCANANVPDEAVYQITRTLYDNLPFLQEMHASAGAIGLETALDRPLLPTHEGAARYYREVGVAVPGPEPLRVSTLSRSPFLTRYASVDEARTRVNESTITILGGDAGETITRMITELASPLAESGIRVVGMTTSAPVENIADVLYARGVDSAAVPLDVATYALEQDVYSDIGGKIVYITELFTNEVHLLASDSIEEISDLIDRQVNLGPRGSASAFTVSFLLDRLNIQVEPTYVDQRTALSMLRRGDIEATFMVSGKPMPLLSEIPERSGLHLLPVPRLDGDAYRPATIAPADYPNLVTDGETIDTFGVRSVLISYNWRPDNPRYRVLSSFTDAFFERLPSLQEHPKWREIDPRRDLSGWRRSPAAQSWIEGRRDAGPENEATTDG